jgi:hypothetical protein
MKNIRSNSIAALSIMLLLSTTASHGTYQGALTSLASYFPSREQAANAGKAAVEAVKAHPYISAAIAATPVVGYGLYKAGKYAFGKKTANLDLIAADINGLNATTAKRIVTEAEKAQKAELAKQATSIKKAAPSIQEQAKKVLTTVGNIANANNLIKGKVVDQAQEIQIQQDLIPLVKSIKQLPVSDLQTAAANFVRAAVKYAKSNELADLYAANNALKKTLDGIINQPTLAQTVAKKAYAKLPTTKQALIGGVVAAVAVPAAYYGYKNGYFKGVYNFGANLVDAAVKRFAKAPVVAPTVQVITPAVQKAVEAVTDAAMEAAKIA